METDPGTRLYLVSVGGGDVTIEAVAATPNYAARQHNIKSHMKTLEPCRQFFAQHPSCKFLHPPRHTEQHDRTKKSRNQFAFRRGFSQAIQILSIKRRLRFQLPSQRELRRCSGRIS